MKLLLWMFAASLTFGGQATVNAATLADQLAELKETSRQLMTNSPQSTNLVHQWLQQKKDLSQFLQSNPRSMGEASNQLCLLVARGSDLATVLYFDSLIEVLDRSDGLVFLDTAYAAVSAPGNSADKNRLLRRAYVMASTTRSNDLAIRDRASRNLRAAASMQDRRLQLSALAFLTVGFDGLGAPWNTGGLDPDLGKRLLRELVEDSGMPFRDKEPFALLLAKADKGYVDYYHQNVKTLYLKSLHVTSAEHRLLYAERLYELGRVTEKELEEYKRAARAEQEERKKTGGVVKRSRVYRDGKLVEEE
jgi:hypothetical protein